MILRLLPLILISGCSLIGGAKPIPEINKVEVVTVTTPAPQYHPPLPSSISTVAVEWTVLTPATMQEYLEDLEAGNAPNNAYYGLTPKGYENLTSNMAEVKRYLRQVLSILDYYKNPEETP
jgi:hypothetical protein